MITTASHMAMSTNAANKYSDFPAITVELYAELYDSDPVTGGLGSFLLCDHLNAICMPYIKVQCTQACN